MKMLFVYPTFQLPSEIMEKVEFSDITEEFLKRLINYLFSQTPSHE